MVAEISAGLGYFLPIFSFLLVFIVVYAVLQKTGILGNKFVNLFISFLMAAFFIIEVQLVDFVRFTSSWFVVFIMLIFFVFLIMAFMPWKEPLKFLSEKNWFSIVVLILLIVFFIVASSYIFNWAINWDLLSRWFHTDWFGFVLLLVIAGIVSIVLTKKVA